MGMANGREGAARSTDSKETHAPEIFYSLPPPTAPGDWGSPTTLSNDSLTLLPKIIHTGRPTEQKRHLVFLVTD